MAFIQVAQAGGNYFQLDFTDGGPTSGGSFQGGGSKDAGAGVIPNPDPNDVPNSLGKPVGPIAIGAATGTVLGQLSNGS